jgi:hypothetical protein
MVGSGLVGTGGSRASSRSSNSSAFIRMASVDSGP